MTRGDCPLPRTPGVTYSSPVRVQSEGPSGRPGRVACRWVMASGQVRALGSLVSSLAGSSLDEQAAQDPRSPVEGAGSWQGWRLRLSWNVKSEMLPEACPQLSPSRIVARWGPFTAHSHVRLQGPHSHHLCVSTPPGSDRGCAQDIAMPGPLISLPRPHMWRSGACPSVPSPSLCTPESSFSDLSVQSDQQLQRARQALSSCRVI